jgi:hypothetical protein
MKKLVLACALACIATGCSESQGTATNNPDVTPKVSNLAGTAPGVGDDCQSSGKNHLGFAGYPVNEFGGDGNSRYRRVKTTSSSFSEGSLAWDPLGLSILDSDTDTAYSLDENSSGNGHDEDCRKVYDLFASIGAINHDDMSKDVRYKLTLDLAFNDVDFSANLPADDGSTTVVSSKPGLKLTIAFETSLGDEGYSISKQQVVPLELNCAVPFTAKASWAQDSSYLDLDNGEKKYCDLGGKCVVFQAEYTGDNCTFKGVADLETLDGKKIHANLGGFLKLTDGDSKNGYDLTLTNVKF